jgi:uncharacterized tellurite resistance protein B-like protein
VLKVLADVLAGVTGGGRSRRRPDDVMLTATAVVIDLALVDGQMTAREHEWLRAAVRRYAGLEGAAADAFLDRAVVMAREAGDITGILSDLRHRLGPEQRKLMVAEMWRLALADRVLHEFEETVLARAADLLGLSEAEALLIRNVETARAHV